MPVINGKDGKIRQGQTSGSECQHGSSLLIKSHLLHIILGLKFMELSIQVIYLKWCLMNGIMRLMLVQHQMVIDLSSYISLIQWKEAIK
jgi:hypothetical protein